MNKDAAIAHVKIEAIILFFILMIPPGFFFPFISSWPNCVSRISA
jgi:hypothetical protein